MTAAVVAPVISLIRRMISSAHRFSAFEIERLVFPARRIRRLGTLELMFVPFSRGVGLPF
jgi:hypothetical protein